MEKNKPYKAEELLEQIFYYMSELVNERRFDNTICLLTDLGKILVNSDRASLWYYDVKKKQYWTLAASGSERIVVPEGTGIIGATISNKEIIVMNHPYEDDRFNPEVDKETGYVTKSILCMPVTNEKGQVIGAFQAINKMGEDGEAAPFDEKDIKRLAMVAAYCNKTLESHLLYEAAQVDPLTGLKNRRGFFEYYGEQVREDNDKRPTAVIICDIDFFKKVNDTYGHNAGDMVLMHVADILQRNIMNGDEVVRWGGEEFVMLLSKCSISEAVAFAENIRKQVEESTCEFGGQIIKITMSFGVAPLLIERSSDENIREADERLYQAKESGRNRVVS
ncbi:MAG: sensor domain-containing diguanylate cyclase [Lachnospira sp.]|nr:sensor domain-containing diguanylate cyclase [Lachnospira sp.]